MLPLTSGGKGGDGKVHLSRPKETDESVAAGERTVHRAWVEVDAPDPS